MICTIARGWGVKPDGPSKHGRTWLSQTFCPLGFGRTRDSLESGSPGQVTLPASLLDAGLVIARCSFVYSVSQSGLPDAGAATKPRTMCSLLLRVLRVLVLPHILPHTQA